MFIPATDDNVDILINSGFDFLHIISFDIMFLVENKMFSVPIKLCHATITLDMDMDWLMFFAIKEERETEETKNFRHNLYYY